MLTDTQLRAYFLFLFGDDEPAPAIIDASDDALEPYPAPHYEAPRLVSYGPLERRPNPDESWSDLLSLPL